jgi:hypothetical protein
LLSKSQDLGADESILLLKIKKYEARRRPSVISHVNLQPAPNVSGSPSILPEADVTSNSDDGFSCVLVASYVRDCTRVL